MLKKKPEIGQYAVLTSATGQAAGRLVRIKTVTPGYYEVENVFGPVWSTRRFNGELQILEDEKEVFVHMLKQQK